jgi:hypothetical protein
MPTNSPGNRLQRKVVELKSHSARILSPPFIAVHPFRCLRGKCAELQLGFPVEVSVGNMCRNPSERKPLGLPRPPTGLLPQTGQVKF